MNREQNDSRSKGLQQIRASQHKKWKPTTSQEHNNSENLSKGKTQSEEIEQREQEGGGFKDRLRNSFS